MRAIRLLLLVLALVGAAAARGEPAALDTPLRIGLTPVFLDEQVGFLNEWRRYLESRLDRPVRFVKKASYREIVELLQADKLEFAWLCGYPFVMHAAELRLVSVPVWQGRPLYQSYLIVPAGDLATKGFAELRNRIFAYSDPNSNSGFLVVQEALRRAGTDPAAHFRKSFFTWSHRKVIEAVAAGLADGGAVDGYVFDSLARIDPALTARTRVVERSAHFGFPPIVAHRRVREADARALREVLRGMQDDAQGRRLLGQLNLDGFGAGELRLFEGIARMAANQQRAAHVP